MILGGLIMANAQNRNPTSAARIQNMIENTKKNMSEAEISMEFAGKEET